MRDIGDMTYSRERPRRVVSFIAVLNTWPSYVLEKKPTVKEWQVLVKMHESFILTRTQESNENSHTSRIVRRKEPKSFQIHAREIWSVAFLVDGNHIVGGGADQKIGRWRVEDGREVEMPIMGARSAVRGIAVSQDGRCVVSGTSHGVVTVWNAKTREKVSEFKARSQGEVVSVCAIDVSPGSTRIATGSEDGTVHVWSLDTGEQLLGPLQHDYPVVGVKFSPKGRLIATATQWGSNSVRVYNSQNGRLVVDFPVRVNSLAWARDNKQLFALSCDGNISSLDVSTGITLSHWPIQGSNDPRCISLASNGAFIAASGSTSVSFWDTTTHKKIGSLVQHPDIVECMAISANYDIVVGGGQTITLRSLSDILPPAYCKDVSAPVSEAGPMC